MMGETTDSTNRAQVSGLAPLVWGIGVTIGYVSPTSADCTILTKVRQSFSRRVTFTPTRKVPGLVRKSILGRILIPPPVSVLCNSLRFRMDPRMVILERGQRARSRLMESLLILALRPSRNTTLCRMEEKHTHSIHTNRSRPSGPS